MAGVEVIADAVSVRLGETPALTGVSLRVPPGTSLAVTGVNGAGKSTLLRVLAGLLRPDAGRVQVGDRTADERDPQFRRLLAALIGPPATSPALTVEEHLGLLALSWAEPAADGIERGADVLDTLGAPHLLARYPHELSSGQAQMVSLALTLTRPADVLVLDEPEQRLDTGRVEVLGGILRERVDAGTTLVLATHDLPLRRALGGRTLELDSTGHAR